jgi:hypothetical protein
LNGSKGSFDDRFVRCKLAFQFRAPGCCNSPCDIPNERFVERRFVLAREIPHALYVEFRDVKAKRRRILLV